MKMYHHIITPIILTEVELIFCRHAIVGLGYVTIIMSVKRRLCCLIGKIVTIVSQMTTLLEERDTKQKLRKTTTKLDFNHHKIA